MASILQSLNEEWSALAGTPAARRAVMRWTMAHRVFAAAEHLDDVLELGRCPQQGPEVRRALAAMAPTDELAARTAPSVARRLTNLARRIGSDADAIDEMVSWAGSASAPTPRTGQGRCRATSGSTSASATSRSTLRKPGAPSRHPACHSSPRPRIVLLDAFVRELVTAGEQRGLPGIVLETIIRSRVGGESITDLAAEQRISSKVLLHRWWRAEARLRELPPATEISG